MSPIPDSRATKTSQRPTSADIAVATGRPSNGAEPRRGTREREPLALRCSHRDTNLPSGPGDLIVFHTDAARIR
jgi:hypothetical protein